MYKCTDDLDFDSLKEFFIRSCSMKYNTLEEFNHLLDIVKERPLSDDDMGIYGNYIHPYLRFYPRCSHEIQIKLIKSDIKFLKKFKNTLSKMSESKDFDELLTSLPHI